jgi:hypothetical protein
MAEVGDDEKKRRTKAGDLASKDGTTGPIREAVDFSDGLAAVRTYSFPPANPGEQPREPLQLIWNDPSS